MYQKHIVNNKLSVILAPIEHTETVTVLIMVKAGSKYETKDINGMSHFLEHMFFKGTIKRPSSTIITETLDRVGGEYNAFTGKEYTGYYAKVAAKHLDLALDVVSDIFLHSLIDVQEIEKEKGVIAEEINMFYDTPMRYIGDLWESLLYGDQPAGWDIAGTKEIIQTFKRENFIKYLNERYVDSNTVVFVSGKIQNTDELLNQIKVYFADIRSGEYINKLSVTEKQNSPQILIHNKKTDQTHIMLGFRAYDIWHKDKYALKLLSIILGGGMSSRLFEEIREKRGLTYYIHTENEHHTDTGFLATNAGIKNEKIYDAIEAIVQEHNNILNNGIHKNELYKAKEYVKGKLLLSLETSEQIASYLALQEILKSEIILPDAYCQIIDNVTIDDIMRVAHDVFQKSKLNLALIGPFEKSIHENQFLEILNS